MRLIETIILKKPSLNKTIIIPIAAVLSGILGSLFPEILGLIIGAALVYYFWGHREHLVFALIIYTPLEELILKLMPDNLYAPVRFMWEIVLFSIFALMLLENVILNKNWKQSVIDKAAIVFVSGWLLSGFINHIPIFASLFYIKNFVRYFPLFYIIYNLKPNERFLKTIIYAFVGVALVESLICFGQALGIQSLIDLFRPREVTVAGNMIRGEDIQTGSYYTRFTGTFARSNDLGNYLAFGLCFLGALYFKLARKRSYVVIASILLVALIISSSRISLISAFIAIGVILFKVRHRLRYKFFVVPIVLAMVVLFGFATLDTTNIYSDFNIMGRFYYLFTTDYIDNISNFGRLYVIIAAVPAVLMNSPIWGIGPGSFMNLSAEIPADDVFARSGDLGLEAAPLNYVPDVGFAAVFIQVGMIGLLALIWIFKNLYKSASKAFTESNRPIINVLMLAGMSVIISMAIQNFASTNLMYRNQSVVIWTVCGLIGLFARNLNESNNGQTVIQIPDNNIDKIKD